MEGEWKTGELGVTSSNPPPNSTLFFLIFLEIYSGDFDNVKVYILEKKIGRKMKK